MKRLRMAKKTTLKGSDAYQIENIVFIDPEGNPLGFSGGDTTGTHAPLASELGYNSPDAAVRDGYLRVAEVTFDTTSFELNINLQIPPKGLSPQQRQHITAVFKKERFNGTLFVEVMGKGWGSVDIYRGPIDLDKAIKEAMS